MAMIPEVEGRTLLLYLPQMVDAPRDELARPKSDRCFEKDGSLVLACRERKLEGLFWDD
jgi:hypothetical protein